MAISPDKKARLANFAGRRLARLISFVDRSSSLVTEPADLPGFVEANHPAIGATWHGQFMMLPAIRRRIRRPFAAMVARHGDAELIGAALEEFDIELIRGAGAGSRQKDRGGAQALRNSVRALAEGKSLVMTADIPPGPARRVGMGIITLARMSGRPIIPIVPATSRYRSLETWSRMTINLPFGRMACVTGEPIGCRERRTRRCSKPSAKRLRPRSTRLFFVPTSWQAEAAHATPAIPDPNAPAASPGMLLKSYRAGMTALRPGLPLLLKLRERQGKEDPRRRGERFGLAGQARPSGVLVWAHAASVGETNAVLPVIEALTKARPDLKFLLTTGTVTSAALAAQRLKGNAVHQYVPLDARNTVARFLDHWKPHLAIFTNPRSGPIRSSKWRAATSRSLSSMRDYRRVAPNAGNVAAATRKLCSIV